MRILATTMLVIAAGTMPAHAKGGQPYLEVDFGALMLDDLQLDTVSGTAEIHRDLKSGLGYDAALVFGYDTGPVRLEVEGSAKRGFMDQITRTKFNTLTGTSNVITFDATGSTSAYAVMANALIDIGDEEGVQGFVGGGVGYSWIKADVKTASNVLVDKDNSLAWQILAGLRLPVSNKLDLGLKYRFFNTQKLDMVTPFNQQVTPTWRSHSLMATLAYNIGGGGDDEPMAMVPTDLPAPYVPPLQTVPAQPKAPPVQTCNTGPYVVFFDWDQSALSDTAKSALDAAVSQYAWCGNVRVLLSGHADRSGSAAYNIALSRARNAAVRRYLTTRGIADAAIGGEAYGESKPLVATQDGVREPQNRRVEVNFGPGSGN
jgi:OmpA-OmpF porin, OOP family